MAVVGGVRRASPFGYVNVERERRRKLRCMDSLAQGMRRTQTDETVARVGLMVSLLAAAIVLIAACGGETPTPDAVEESGESVRVTRVVDGDTVDVCCPEARVRLLGIDSPERGEPLFQEAASMADRLTTGQKVRMTRCEEEADQYGRILRHLFTKDAHVNRELVAAGLARAYDFSLRLNPCYKDELLAAEEIARSQCLGLWQS